MNQMTFSDMEYSGRKRVTQKEKFLHEMNDIIPRADWINIFAPYYPKGKRGRPPRGIEVMLRMYLLQIWFNLSDEGLEDAIYDSYAMRNFVGINFLEEQVPDATTLLKFRHLLEKHNLGEAIFNDIKERLQKAGLMMRAAPSWTRLLSIPLLPSRIRKESGIRRCTRPRRATSGIMA